MIQYIPFKLFIDGNPPHRRGKVLDANPSTVKGYEERIRITLNAIARTNIGKLLFKSLDYAIPVYVVPYTDKGCNARTGQLSSDFTKGIRIQYSPETWSFDACGQFPGYRPVESLFHEMVHASRFTNFGFVGLNNDPLDKMQDHEEFFAVMVTNMFREEEGAKKFNRDYMTGTLVSQAELEAFLSSNPAYIDGLDYFLGSDDPLVKLLLTLSTALNPFRDFNRLKP